MQNQIDKNQEQKNIELVNKAFDTLFNKRDYYAILVCKLYPA
jgi:hypothetical protein